MASVSNLEKLRGGKPAPLTTRRFFSGLFTLRSPLNEPGDGASTRYYEAIAGAKSDALLGGLNIEVSNKNTLVTRPGSTQTFSTVNPFYFLGSYAAIMNSATATLADRNDAVLYENSTVLYIKGTHNYRTFFLNVGNYTFMSSLADSQPRIWDGNPGHTTDMMGITTPAVTPSLTLNSGTGMTASSGWQYVYAYASSRYIHVSTASPISASTGPGIWHSITVQGPRSSDTSVDTVQIYRTLDGGSTYQFVGSVANPASGNFSYTDTSLDSALNPFVLAPQNGANNPPTAFTGSLSGFAYSSGRLWGASGNTLYFSGGPDTTNGNGLLAWPPTNYFVFPNQIYRIVPYANGLLVFTAKDIFAVLGTSTTTFYPKLQQAGMGILNYYAVDVKGSEIYVFTSTRQFIMISPSSGVVDVGFPIGDKLLSFPPNNTFVAYYTNGEDDAVYVCDGTSNIYRMNPHQYPEGNICWSPVAQPVNGCSGLFSSYDDSNNPILVTVSQNGLLLSRRDITVSQDMGSSYEADVIIGPVSLANPGDLAEVNSITVESTAVGNRPIVSVLTNEISGSTTTLGTFVSDPPQLPAFSSYHSDRYYIKQAESGLCRQIQLKIDYPAENASHEVLGFSVYGDLRPHE